MFDNDLWLFWLVASFFVSKMTSVARENISAPFQCKEMTQFCQRIV